MTLDVMSSNNISQTKHIFNASKIYDMHIKGVSIQMLERDIHVYIY
jgi:hypothetical protein